MNPQNAATSDAIERAIERCVAAIRADRPERGWWARHCWRRRWRRQEYGWFVDGGMYGSLQWYVVKEATSRVGDIW